MKEYPALFMADMVRAILKDRKTNTRRVLESPRYLKTYYPYEGDQADDGWPMTCHRKTGCLTRIPSPYGTLGDRIWVRETWGTWGAGDSFVAYRATDAEQMEVEDSFERWHPSIHMPRYAARLLLDHTAAIRVERLQDISEADAQAEGVEKNWIGPDCPPEYADEWRDYNPLNTDGFPCFSARDSFTSLWDEINAGRGHSWASNPWVWRVEFKRVPQ